MPVLQLLAEFRLQQQIHPSELVRGDNLRLRAETRNMSDAFQLPTDSIPESYFKSRYRELKDQLVTNRARHDNCDTIARDRREFFECYYQKNLLTD